MNTYIKLTAMLPLYGNTICFDCGVIKPDSIYAANYTTYLNLVTSYVADYPVPACEGDMLELDLIEDYDEVMTELPTYDDVDQGNDYDDVNLPTHIIVEADGDICFGWH